MLCLDSTDVIEGGASVDAVIDYTLHGLVGTAFTQLAAGVMSTTLTAVLYTAGAAMSIVSIILVNKHTSAVDITLCLDPANGGNPRYLIPKTISLGAGYSLHTDGARLTIIDANGGLVSGLNVSDTAYGAGWNGVTAVAPSKNAVYDELELRTKAAAVIADNQLVRGDGGARGVQESTIVVDDSGRMTNPSQPCFLVQPTANQSNIATGSDVTVIWGTEVFDIGNNFASNTFTAPITGKYLLSFGLRLNLLDTATYYWAQIKTSNRLCRSFIIEPLFTADPAYWQISGSVVTDMDANDTGYITILQGGGTVQTDIDDNSHFSGALIC